MRLLAISGSLRQGSYNTALLGAVAAELPPGIELAVWDGLAHLPAYAEDVDTVPPAVVAFREEVAQADAVLIATPEYNGSVPGALKNALDWASRPFPDNSLRGKPIAVVGASTGLFGAVWAQADLRRILRVIGATVDERELPVGRAHEAFDADGRLRDPALAATLREIVSDLTVGRVRRAA